MPSDLKQFKISPTVKIKYYITLLMSYVSYD